MVVPVLFNLIIGPNVLPASLLALNTASNTPGFSCRFDLQQYRVLFGGGL
jgi:hypothetical protein